MIALLLMLLLSQPPQDPSVPSPNPAEPESDFELSMPGERPSESFGERPEPEMAFFLTGTVVEIGPEQVRLRRRGEIDADLILTPETSIVLDGENVSFDEVPLGSEAQAEFVLRGAERVVIELRVPR